MSGAKALQASFQPWLERLVRPALPLTLLLAIATASLPAQTARCGVARWPVKIVVDDDSARVDLTPRDTTVAALAAMPRPAGLFPQRARVVPEELVTWRVRAILWEVRVEPDGDLHVILADPAHTDVRMIAELPDSACAIGSRHAATYAEVSRQLRGIGRRQLVTVTGIAFFDHAHGQRNAAPNNIELHPVLRIERAP